jgi:hypothetical protein
MPEEMDWPTEDLRRVAEITFRKRVSKLYDPVLRETKDLAEIFANEGTASAGKYQRKVADEVFAKFESIEATLEEIYVDQLYGQNLPTDDEKRSVGEQWLREKIAALIDAEVVRAQQNTENLGSSFFGPFAKPGEAFKARIGGEGATMKQRLGEAITARTLVAKRNAKPTGSSEAPNPATVFGSAAPVAGVPTAFISYSWDSEEHKAWVLALAERLTHDGVRVILDRWHLSPGADRTHFMESGVRDSDFVLVICTPEYAKKANARTGGVAYEAMIITAELAREVLQRKFIPVLRGGSWGPTSQPTWLESKMGVNLRDNPYDKKQYEDLVRTLHQEPLLPPPLGVRPAFSVRLDSGGSGTASAAGPESLAKKESAASSPLVFVGSRVIPVSDNGETWSVEMGRFERQLAISQGRFALVAKFANEARPAASNRGWLVKASLIFREQGKEVRRIVGSWLEEPTDFVEIRVDEARELLVLAVFDQRPHTIGKRRIRVDLNGEEILTDIEPIAPAKMGSVTVRLTDADTGQFLTQYEFKLQMDSLTLEGA